MTTKIKRAIGIGESSIDVFPVPVKATRAPTSSDTKFPLGQSWVRTDTAQAWTLCQLSSGAATWAIASPGASDVDTINNLSPAAGNMTIAGGTNVTDVNAGSTVTLNLDDAITLATSVTSPVYTSAAGMSIEVAAGANNLVMKMGDAAGAQKVSFTDSADLEVASIDSSGAFTTTGLTFTGLLTANASATINTAGTALNLATDNSGDAVNIGTGATIRAVGIANAGGVAHTVAIGSASAGAMTIDTAAGISFDSAAASNFTVTGAADLTFSSSLGSLILNAEEAAADAIQIQTAAGGVDWNSALQSNIDSSEAAVNAVRIVASNAAGGIDIDSGTGGIAVDSTGAISLDAAAASNFSVSGAGVDLSFVSAAGRIVMNGEEAAADALRLLSAAGGLDVDVALQMNLTSSQAAADAIRIFASDAAGGIDVDCGTGGMNFTSTGVIDFVSTGVFTINSSAGAINIGDGADAFAMNYGTGAAARTLTFGNATGATSIIFNCGTGDLLIGQNAVARNVQLGNSTGASSLTLAAGTGRITMTGTVKEIDAQFLFADGTDLLVTQSPIMQSNADTGVAPTGATGDVNLLYMQDGCLMEQFILGAGQTIIAPRMTANGLNIALDQANAEGAEYNFGSRSNAKHVYTIGTDAAFFAEAKIYVGDMSGCAPLMIGFRKVEANNAVMADYTDYAAIGLNTVTSATNVSILTELNAGGQTATDTTDAWGGDGTVQTVKVLVSSAGVVTFEVGGVSASAAPAFTFDNADEVMFFCHFLHGADLAGEVGMQALKIGFQA